VLSVAQEELLTVVECCRLESSGQHISQTPPHSMLDATEGVQSECRAMSPELRQCSSLDPDDSGRQYRVCRHGDDLSGDLGDDLGDDQSDDLSDDLSDVLTHELAGLLVMVSM
jgi:hypothetical protein